MRNLYKSLLIIILIIFSTFCAFADSFTFSTAINTVSGGYGGFGLGLFPVATGFGYSKSDFNLIPNYRHPAYVNLSSRFLLSSVKIDNNYSYDEGRPAWDMRNIDKQEHNFINGEYFQPEAYINAYITQGFGTNPVSGTDTLVDISIGFSTTYRMALEPLKASVDGSGFVFVDNEGNLQAPYGGYIQAFPWLSGNRRSFNNYLYASTSWNFYKTTGRSSYDGAYAELRFEYGPSWLANTNESGVMSDYYRLYGYLEEKLTLFSTLQKNGSNWLTIHFGHGNSLQYIGGDVVPQNKIPEDRFRARFVDSLWLEFQLPQFLVGDCFSYVKLGLNNNLYFGHVVNEIDQKSFGAELKSSVFAYYHLRLFGFIKFEYEFGFNLFRGIWANHPGFYQWAMVTFSVTL